MGSDPIYKTVTFVKTGLACAVQWKTYVTDDRERAGLSISICEEALSKFGQSDDSLVGVIREHDISVRDFMLLSLVCDQECFEVEQLARALGLEIEEILRSILRLAAADMVCADPDLPSVKTEKRVCAT